MHSGTFWYTNIYKQYRVIWYTFVKTGYGGTFQRGTENLSNSLGKPVLPSYNPLKIIQAYVNLNFMHITSIPPHVCFPVRPSVCPKMSPEGKSVYCNTFRWDLATVATGMCQEGENNCFHNT